MIRESPGLERGPFLRWLETAIREAETEAAHREEEQPHWARRLSRLAELERKGVAAEVEVAQASRERNAADRESEAARVYLELLKWLWNSVEEAVFERGGDGKVFVQLRLPGITQRVGVADYFTLRIVGDESLRKAVSEVETGICRIRGAAAFGLPGSFLVSESAVAVPLSLETADLAKPLLRFRARAKGEMQVRWTQWEDAKRQLRLVNTAVEKGVVNEVRRQRVKMTVDVAEAAWKEVEARSRLSQLEWARFEKLSGEDDSGDFHQEDGQTLPWGDKSSDLVAGLQDVIGSGGRTTAEIRATVRLGRAALRARAAVETSRDRLEAASCLVRRLGLIQSATQTERDAARMARELAEAELQWTEEQLLELRLALQHESGLSKLDLQKKLDRWSLVNAAAWGKQIARVEAEVAQYRRQQVEMRLGQEQKRLAALRPLMGNGASTPYEIHQQELTSRMAEGAWWAVLRKESRIGVKTAFLEEICGAAKDPTTTGQGNNGLPDRAWTLLTTYACATASACPGKLLELEAARDSVNLRRDELLRLREAGLARSGEVRETKHLSTVLLGLAGAELAKNQVSDALQQLICAASMIDAATPEAKDPNSLRVIAIAPLP